MPYYDRNGVLQYEPGYVAPTHTGPTSLPQYGTGGAVGNVPQPTTAAGLATTPLVQPNTAQPYWATSNPNDDPLAYGPNPQPAPVVAPVVPPAPTSASGVQSQLGLNAQEQAALDAYYEAQRTTGNTPVDENAVRTQELANRQAEIDRINAYYADMINNSRITNAPGYKARLDQNRIQQVMGGISSGPMGAAQTSGIETSNNQEQARADALIASQRQDAMNAVYNKIDESVSESIKAKNLAKKESLDSYITHLNEKPEKARKLLASTIADVLSNPALSDMTPEDLKALSDKLGLSVESVTAEYNRQKSSQTAAQTKAQQEADKNTADIANTNAQAAERTFNASGKMTDYQSEQTAIEWYKANHPTGTAGDRKLNAIGMIATVFNPALRKPDGTMVHTILKPNGEDTGIPYIDESNKITPEGWKAVVLNSAEDGVTKKDLIEQWGAMINVDTKEKQRAYELTDAEVKRIQGLLPEPN